MLIGRKIIFFACLLLLAACTKNTESFEDINEQDPIGVAPVIELLEVMPTTAQEYTDSIAFTIKYTDGDGDIGTNDPDIPSVRLVDNRDAELLIFDYHLSPRTPEGSELIIQGELTIVLANTILLDDSNDSETTTFSIRLTDRAGNESNVLETGTITVVK